MNGITIMKGRTPLRLLSVGVDPNNEGKPVDSENNPDTIKLESEPGKRMIEACEEYTRAMGELQKLEAVGKKSQVDALLELVGILANLVLRKGKKPDANYTGELQLDTQRHYVDECITQVVETAMETFCLGGDSEIIFYALYEALINKSGGVVRPESYEVVLERVVQKMIRQLMDQKEMLAISEHLSSTVGKIVGTDESGRHGLQGQVEALTAQVLERSIAMGPFRDMGNGKVTLAMLAAPRQQRIIEGAKIGRMQFEETENLIKRLVRMLTAD